MISDKTIGRLSLYRRAVDKLLADGRTHVYSHEIASFCGVTPAQLAIAWLLQRPGVTSVILGATRLEHLEEALRALEVKLDATTTEALDALAPP